MELSVGRSRFTWRGRRVDLPLSGRFNVDNALVAAAIGAALGVAEERVVGGPGRRRRRARADGGRWAPARRWRCWSTTPTPRPGSVGAASAARSLAGGGTGGVRVRLRRGPRPRASAPRWARWPPTLADVVVLTSDNPRSEDPLAIIDAGPVRHGPPAPPVTVEPDRAAAIRVAVGRARPGDVVLVAGKGHEDTQTQRGDHGPLRRPGGGRAALAERFGGTTR